MIIKISVLADTKEYSAVKALFKSYKSNGYSEYDNEITEAIE